MTKCNRIVKLSVTAAVAFILILSTCLCAAAASVDLTRKCSITFTMAYDGEPVAGGSLKMVRIASWVYKDYTYTFEWVPELADAGLNLNEAGTETFARHVFMLVESRSLPALSDIVGKDGTVTFSNLKSGLYVVYQTEPAKGYEPINAFCVSLPIKIDDTYVYDVQASPKPRPETTDTTSSTTPEPSTSPGSTKPSEPTTSPVQTTKPDSPSGTTRPDTPTTPEPTTSPSHSTPTPPRDEPVTQPSTTHLYEPEAPPIISMEDKLPQTGQLWWPTWMLGAFGVMLLGFGVLLRVLIRRSAEDAGL